MAITRFEDIQAWQVARQLAKRVYGVTRKANFARDFGLRDQTQRAVVSIMANIAEGFDSRSNSEFIQFLYYALRSASEVQSHLYVAKDQGYVSEPEFAEAYENASSIKAMIFKFIEHLRTHERP